MSINMTDASTIVVPRGALPYILLQRTAYKVPGKKMFTRIERRWPYLSVRLQSLLFKNAITRAYSTDMGAEFANIEPHVPLHAKAILDIGCGVGGLEVFLNHCYPTAKLFLLDRTESDPIHYYFTKRAAFYNSLETGQELLMANGVQKEQVILASATDSYDLPQEKFDLVVSLIAWGFHFPLETYLSKVYAQLQLGGVLIVDVRAGTGGEELLKKTFGNTKVIHSGKNVRVVCKKDNVMSTNL
jgi:SAM-dependent methyltransferase